MINAIKGAKKAQTSIFIIIGIILVIAVSLALYLALKGPAVETAVKTAEIQQPLGAFVESCIRERTEEGALLLAAQAGHNPLPSDSVIVRDILSAYGIRDGRGVLVSLGTVEGNLNSFIRSTMDECLKGFSSFPSMKVTPSEMRVSSKINPDEIIVDLDYPLKIESGSSVTEESRFRARVPVRLGYLHAMAEYIIAHTLADTDWIDLSYMASLDADVSVVPLTPDTYAFMIYDPASRIRERRLLYLFSVHIPPNRSPLIEFPSEIELTDNVRYTATVKVTDPGDTFVVSTDHPMVEMTPDGKIDFIPRVRGEFIVRFTATDSHQATDEKEVKFVVKRR